ncbi:hypothetical protein DR64_3437 [Paraburkholderia xenovorans LB400]|nr:hypothetical protein [Paraburkholderia xenovorans]AIP30283.1 hypothetical protein DR64_3437 [Paraburkholderia xenovorans LB400]
MVVSAKKHDGEAVVLTPPVVSASAAPALPTSTPTASSSTAPSPTPEPTTKVKRVGGGHQKPKPISMAELSNDLVRVRVSNWLWLLKISASAFYARVDAGNIPEPTGKDGPSNKRPYWTAGVVRSFLEQHQP